MAGGEAVADGVRRHEDGAHRAKESDEALLRPGHRITWPRPKATVTTARKRRAMSMAGGVSCLCLR